MKLLNNGIIILVKRDTIKKVKKYAWEREIGFDNNRGTAYLSLEQIKVLETHGEIMDEIIDILKGEVGKLALNELKKEYQNYDFLILEKLD